MKTKTERLQMADDLLKIKPHIIKESLFGDDHHAAIQAQIWVLANAINRTQIVNRYQDNEHGDFPNSEYELESALIAWDWINDECEAGQTTEEWWGELRKED